MITTKNIIDSPDICDDLWHKLNIIAQDQSAMMYGLPLDAGSLARYREALMNWIIENDVSADECSVGY